MKKFVVMIITLLLIGERAESYNLIKMKTGTIFRGVIVKHFDKSIIIKMFDGENKEILTDSILESNEKKSRILTKMETTYSGFICDFDSNSIVIRTEDSAFKRLNFSDVLVFGDSTLNNILVDKGLSKHSDFYLEENSNKIQIPCQKTVYNSNYLMLGLTFVTPGILNGLIGYSSDLYYIRFSLGLFDYSNSRGGQLNMGLAFSKWENGEQALTIGIGSTNVYSPEVYDKYADIDEVNPISYYSGSYSINYKGLFCEIGLGLSTNVRKSAILLLQIGYVYLFN